MFSGCVKRSGQTSTFVILAILIITAGYFTPYVLSAAHSLPVKIALISMPLFFLLALINTNFALIVLIISMLLSPEYSLGGLPGRNIMIRIDDIIIFMIFAGWMLKMAIHKNLGLARISSLNKPIGAYILICVLSSAWGSVIGTTRFFQSTFYVLKYVEYFIVFFMFTNNIENIEQIKRFIAYLIATSVIVGIYAIWIHLTTGIRASAPFEGEGGESNTLAGYLIIIMSLNLCWAMYAPNKKVMFANIAIFALSFCAFLYTLSRSGWIGFIPAFLVMLIMTKRNRMILLVIASIIAFASPVVIPKIVEKRFHDTFIGRTITVGTQKITIDESAYNRIVAMNKGIKQWGEHPYLGHGVPAGWAVTDVQYIRILHEVGLIGLLIFSWMIFTIYRVSIHVWRSLDIVDDFAKTISLALIASLTGLLTMGWGSEVFIIIRIMEPFWFLVAMVAILPFLKKEDDLSVKTA